jgi:hypothetical protein
MVALVTGIGDSPLVHPALFLRRSGGGRNKASQSSKNYYAYPGVFTFHDRGLVVSNHP